MEVGEDLSSFLNPSGTQYWELTDDGIANGFPRSITEDWEGLPTFLDAAFTWSNGNTYFFKVS